MSTRTPQTKHRRVATFGVCIRHCEHRQVLKLLGCFGVLTANCCNFPFKPPTAGDLSILTRSAYRTVCCFMGTKPYPPLSAHCTFWGVTIPSSCIYPLFSCANISL